MPKKIDPELRERAVRMVREHQQDYPSVTAASKAVAERLGLGRESVRRWVAQAEIDAGAKPGVTSEEHAEIKRLKAENKRLREDVEILDRSRAFAHPDLTTFCRLDELSSSPANASSPTVRSSRAGSPKPTSGAADAAAKEPRGTRSPGSWPTNHSAGDLPRCCSPSAATDALAAGTCGAKTPPGRPNLGRSSRVAGCGGHLRGS